MIFLKNPINAFYFSILIYIAILPVDVDFIYRIIMVVFILTLWIHYILARPRFLGIIDSGFNAEDFKYKSIYAFLFLVFIQLLLAIYVIKFYTGLSIYDVYRNITYGFSNYNSYQTYFAESNLATFSFNKIPAILSFFLVKVILVYIFYSCFVSTNNRYYYFLILVSLFSFVSIGLARGTNFEFFEVLVILISAVYAKRNVMTGYKIPWFRIIFFACLMLGVYWYQIMARYSFDYSPTCLNEFCYDRSSFLHQVVTPLSIILGMISGYFYFAPDYIARLFEYLIEIEGISSLLLFLPFNGFLLDYSPKWLCLQQIKCGPTWAPDFEIFIYFLGLPFFSILLYLLASFHKALAYSSGANFTSFLGYYIITLQIISLPIGSFLFTSSANILLVLFFLAMIIFKKSWGKKQKNRRSLF